MNLSEEAFQRRENKLSSLQFRGYEHSQQVCHPHSL